MSAVPLVKHISAADFEQEVVQSAKPVLIDFYADWCGPCRALAPALEKFAATNHDAVKVVKINVDEAPELARQYGVRSIPALAVVSAGVKIDGLIGNVPQKALDELLARSLQTIAAANIKQGNKPAAKGPKF